MQTIHLMQSGAVRVPDSEGFVTFPPPISTSSVAAPLQQRREDERRTAGTEEKQPFRQSPPAADMTRQAPIPR
jgi:hypothetical protein